MRLFRGVVSGGCAMIGRSDVASLQMPNNTLIRAAWEHGGPSKFLAHRHSAREFKGCTRLEGLEYSRSLGTLASSSFRSIIHTYHILKQGAFQGASPAF